MRAFLFILTLAVLSAGCGGSTRVRTTAIPAAPDGTLPIGAVQGAVKDDADGVKHPSPMTGRTVRVKGVVHQVMMWPTRKGEARHGMMMQNLPEQADGDPHSSDGLFVYLGAEPTLGTHDVKPGHHLVVEGEVAERFNQTELSNAKLITALDPVELDRLPAGDVDPPAETGDAARYWERREGMRVRIPADCQVQGSLNMHWQTGDGRVYVVRGTGPVFERKAAHARRVYRDAHPLDNQPDRLFDDGNAHRIQLSGWGIKAAARDLQAGLPPARSYQSPAAAITGAVHYSWDDYLVAPSAPVTWKDGPDPAANHAPASFTIEDGFSVATFNVENLYDHRNDPFDGCDFDGDPGCPNVRKPFNYLPENEAAYRTRLRALALQILDDLHAPELVMIQEIEDQDICRVVDNDLAFTDKNDADGEPDVLQDLALAIQEQGGPAYRSATDRRAGDDRGIICAYLYRSDRVERVETAGDDPLFGANAQPGFSSKLVTGDHAANPKAFNAHFGKEEDGRFYENVFSRSVVAGRFRVWSQSVGQGTPVEVQLLNNHFSSRPDTRVQRRTRQAGLNAALVKAFGPDALVLCGGDLNVYPLPDEPEPERPARQLAPLYDAGLTNLYDRMLETRPETAYTYVWKGQAQTLDHLFVSTPLLNLLEDVTVSHINCDYTWLGNDLPRGASDHDPVIARFNFPKKKN